MIEKHHADALAALAVACRPYGAPQWDPVGVTAAIAKVKHLGLADVAMAVIRAASDRDAKTPGVITATNSLHWREKLTEPSTKREPYDPQHTCGVCGFAEADCRARWEGDHEFESVRQSAKRAIPAAKRDHVAEADETRKQRQG